MSDEREGDLVVASVEVAAEDVVAVTLADPAGAALPDWTPGAHVDLLLGPDLVRQYSLCSRPSNRQSIRIGVLRTPDGRGGSAHVHEHLLPGATVRVRGPRNHFPLVGAARYCCGPEGLLAAVERRWAEAGWPDGTLHLERFSARPADAALDPLDRADREFELVLARSGRTLTVRPGRSIFDTVQDAGISVLGSCHEGICGTCEQVVLEGEVDHRDSVLSADEQACSEMMMICVSRSRSDRLTLDL